MQYQDPAHQTELLIRSDDQRLSLQGELTSFTQFDGEVNFQNIDLESWMGDTLWQTDLNGSLNADIRFTDMTSPGSLQVNLSESSWQDEQLQRFNLNLSSSGQRATLKLYLDSEFGAVDLTGRIDYTRQVRTFGLRGRVMSLNIQNLTQNEQLDSDVSLTVQADGSFTDLASLETNLYITSEDMELADFSIDTLAIAGIWRNRELLLRTAKLRTPFAGLDIQGQISQNLQHDIELALMISDTLYFPQWIALEPLILPMQVSGNLKGDSISTHADVTARIHQAVYNDMKADSLYISFTGTIDTSGVKGKSHIWGNRIDVGSIGVDSLSLDSQLDSTIENRLSATINSKEKLYTHFTVNQDPPVSIRIDSLYNEWRKTTWHTMGRKATILINPPEYKIQNLYLASNKGRIELESNLNFQGAIEADLIITDVNLSPYSFLLEQYSPLKGSLQSEFQLRGSAESPIFTGQTRIDSLGMGGTQMGDWKLNNEYKEDLLRSSLTWNRGEEQLDFRARIPLSLSFTQPDTTLLQPGGIINIQTEEFNLSVLQFLVPQVTRLQGYMQADLQIKDPLQSPKPSGSLKIEDASLRIPSMGIAYDNILLEGQSEPNRFDLKSLHLETGSGDLNANGYIDYQSTLPSPNISLTIEAENFLIMQSPRLLARIHGQVSVDGSLNQPRYDGQLTVLRSRVDISKFATDSPQSPGDKPLLVQLQPQKEIQKPVQETTPAFTNTIENLQGKIQVRIPRNTWIKSPDMSIEIRGSLDVLKNSAYFEIFGTIETIRGFYEIYGKRFRINEGTIQFQGGEKFNPLLDFTALYSFRSPEGIKKELTIQISGSLQEPDISFMLEGQPIEERDAISYLILGRPYDQLTLSQRSEMETSGGPLGSGMLTNIIAGGFAGTLTSALQQQLNLDIIEFKGDQNWRQASVVIGKYITDDLFLSYERTLAFSRSTEVAPEKVSMEYEVTPWLFLQATKGDEKSTGFDIIWKYRGYNNE
jgi:translocation and assembly module TamB